MKTPRILAIGSLFLSAALTPAAHANLIGDTISMGLGGPTPFSVTLDHTVVVSAGAGDSVNLLSTLIVVNPEADSILVDFNLNSTFTSALFTGLVIANINDLITSVTVVTNLSGWDDSRLAFSGHGIEVNWEGLTVTTSSFFDLHINPEASGNVPEAGASLALLGGGLLGLAGFRRRFARG